ncbi:cytochrome b [Marinimicrobium sp. ABcell2]|uniref:cytochrome b n=1 Tax=Marinimicrobium sp. ABcell2 TaxID=3069751 RepID=UPI0027AE2C26|nr:cytochrome b [Marinimicrobium sp. ABcell2]MDQ2076090.1 cytochrome b [Marinimicrobium sp. ABcell2]
MNTNNRLDATTRLFHWLTAILIFGMLASGAYMATAEVWALYPIHKSIGVLIFPFILVRVVRRLWLGWPEPAHSYPMWERRLAHATHWVLLVGLLALPVTGMLYSGASGHGFGIFGFVLVPTNYDPTQAGQVMAYSETWSRIGHLAHEWLGYILMGAVGLHIVGALKHHYFDRDSTLRRMLGRRGALDVHTECDHLRNTGR